ncbi:type II toxin-antitoxin system HigA family antitoxin [Mucilaginibacter sp. OK283]|jgi:HTH-type transcriptional regulator/antitoxin HigA|uniref:helix-turn-helix domain-containing protein n=1 Tax=Mucilaginibacter sp. OK283 TaxID=1881049 RepID=UPI0008C01C01|nr:transcriptional regulator [Mucilaginibacter sp. OK283]SEP42205.1 HTH-type transcriptional regulator / antitoxin HigA [Mucilaginibacter sp. OK283]
MESTVMKYTIIKNKPQYAQYCDRLETLLMEANTDALQDEIDLLTLLIEKYDEERNTFKETDPISLLRSFMHDHHLKPQDMTLILGIGKGYVSDILNYKKGLSKGVIRKLADHFKVRQEAFNRPYKLISPINAYLRNASVMNTTKELKYAKQ